MKMTNQHKAIYSLRSALRMLHQGRSIAPESKEEQAIRIAYDIISGSAEMLNDEYIQEETE